MDALQRISRDTEEDFLELGERLQNFYERAKNMSLLSSQVATRLSAHEMNEEIAVLQSISTKAKDQTERSTQYTDALEGMLEKLKLIEGRCYAFDKTVRNLHVLCNFIKIENARLGQCDGRFDTLGDDVRMLAFTITSKSSDLLTRSASLSQLIRQYLKTIVDYEAQQQTQARLILNSTNDNLSAMTKQGELASETLNKISSQWESISKSISEIVSSMQFHDITRQRLEHIHDALAELNIRSGRKTENAGEEEYSLLTSESGIQNEDQQKSSLRRVPQTASLCELQKNQLIHAENDLQSALERMSENLRKIADHVLMTSEDIQKIMKVSGNDGQTFLQKMESDLLSLSNAIATYSTLERNLSSYMKTATGAIVQMTCFIHDIQRIGVDMHMIALNASIQSAHVGESGATLSVLAEAILKLSTDTVQNVEEISGILSDVVEEARILSQQGNDEADGGAVDFAGGIEGRIESLLRPIQGKNDDVTSLLSRIDSEWKELAKEIGATVGNLAIHKNMSLQIGEVASVLTDLIADMRSTLPKTIVEPDSTEFSDLAVRYTMEQERQVHQSMMTSGMVAIVLDAVTASDGTSEEGGLSKEMSSPEPTAETITDAEDLGDNVELF